MFIYKRFEMIEWYLFMFLLFFGSRNVYISAGVINGRNMIDNTWLNNNPANITGPKIDVPSYPNPSNGGNAIENVGWNPKNFENLICSSNDQGTTKSFVRDIRNDLMAALREADERRNNPVGPEKQNQLFNLTASQSEFVERPNSLNFETNQNAPDKSEQYDSTNIGQPGKSNNNAASWILPEKRSYLTDEMGQSHSGKDSAELVRSGTNEGKWCEPYKFNIFEESRKQPNAYANLGQTRNELNQYNGLEARNVNPNDNNNGLVFGREMTNFSAVTSDTRESNKRSELAEAEGELDINNKHKPVRRKINYPTNWNLPESGNKVGKQDNVVSSQMEPEKHSNTLSLRRDANKCCNFEAERRQLGKGLILPIAGKETKKHGKLAKFRNKQVNNSKFATNQIEPDDSSNAAVNEDIVKCHETATSKIGHPTSLSGVSSEPKNLESSGSLPEHHININSDLKENNDDTQHTTMSKSDSNESSVLLDEPSKTGEYNQSSTVGNEQKDDSNNNSTDLNEQDVYDDVVTKLRNHTRLSTPLSVTNEFTVSPCEHKQMHLAALKYDNHRPISAGLTKQPNNVKLANTGSRSDELRFSTAAPHTSLTESKVEQDDDDNLTNQSKRVNNIKYSNKSSEPEEIDSCVKSPTEHNNHSDHSANNVKQNNSKSSTSNLNNSNKHSDASICHSGSDKLTNNVPVVNESHNQSCVQTNHPERGQLNNTKAAELVLQPPTNFNINLSGLGDFIHDVVGRNGFGQLSELGLSLGGLGIPGLHRLKKLNHIVDNLEGLESINNIVIGLNDMSMNDNQPSQCANEESSPRETNDAKLQGIYPIAIEQNTNKHTQSLSKTPDTLAIKRQLNKLQKAMEKLKDIKERFRKKRRMKNVCQDSQSNKEIIDAFASKKRLKKEQQNITNDNSDESEKRRIWEKDQRELKMFKDEINRLSRNRPSKIVQYSSKTLDNEALPHARIRQLEGIQSDTKTFTDEGNNLAKNKPMEKVDQHSAPQDIEMDLQDKLKQLEEIQENLRIFNDSVNISKKTKGFNNGQRDAQPVMNAAEAPSRIYQVELLPENSGNEINQMYRNRRRQKVQSDLNPFRGEDLGVRKYVSQNSKNEVSKITGEDRLNKGSQHPETQYNEENTGHYDENDVDKQELQASQTLKTAKDETTRKRSLKSLQINSRAPNEADDKFLVQKRSSSEIQDCTSPNKDCKSRERRQFCPLLSQNTETSETVGKTNHHSRLDKDKPSSHFDISISSPDDFEQPNTNPSSSQENTGASTLFNILLGKTPETSNQSPPEGFEVSAQEKKVGIRIFSACTPFYLESANHKTTQNVLRVD